MEPESEVLLGIRKDQSGHVINRSVCGDMNDYLHKIMLEKEKKLNEMEKMYAKKKSSKNMTGLKKGVTNKNSQSRMSSQMKVNSSNRSPSPPLIHNASINQIEPTHELYVGQSNTKSNVGDEEPTMNNGEE